MQSSHDVQFAKKSIYVCAYCVCASMCMGEGGLEEPCIQCQKIISPQIDTLPQETPLLHSPRDSVTRSSSRKQDPPSSRASFGFLIMGPLFRSFCLTHITCQKDPFVTIGANVFGMKRDCLSFEEREGEMLFFLSNQAFTLRLGNHVVCNNCVLAVLFQLLGASQDTRNTTQLLYRNQ